MTEIIHFVATAQSIAAMFIRTHPVFAPLADDLKQEAILIALEIRQDAIACQEPVCPAAFYRVIIEGLHQHAQEFALNVLQALPTEIADPAPSGADALIAQEEGRPSSRCRPTYPRRAEYDQPHAG